MLISYRTKRLTAICLFILIIVLASDVGTSGSIRDNVQTHVIEQAPLSFPPLDIDPRAIDPDMILPKPSTVPEIVTPPIKKISVVKPVVSAEAYIVANLDTGEIYKSFNPKKVFPIASLTKLVTALVAMHSMDQGSSTIITQNMLDEGFGTAGQLVVGEKFTIQELLYPLLLESSNDAAHALAHTYDYKKFVSAMNAVVLDLGMKSTSFADASGETARNISNADDLLILARYLYKQEKPILDMTREMRHELASTTDHGVHVWNTINPFPLDPHFIGGKTGRTDQAKESMISLFRYEYKGTVYPVAIIVLRSDFKVRQIDSSILFEQFIQKLGNIF